MTTSDTYEVYALRTASWPDRRFSDWFYRFSVYGLPDGPCPMDCFFWLARNDERVVLIDCGFDQERAAARGIAQLSGPVELLAKLDVRPEDVDHVVLSHLHFDHIGNVGLFSNAVFTVARAEIEFWTGPYGEQPAVAAPVESEEVRAIVRLQQDGRVRLVNNEAEVVAGIRAIRVGGHTPGQLITTVATDGGQVVLASDAIHYNAEMRLDRPYSVYTNMEELLGTYAMLRRLAATPNTTVIPGHDPEVMTEFASMAENCVDLTRRRHRFTGDTTR